MIRRVLGLLALLTTLASCAPIDIDYDAELGVSESNVSAAVRRERATLIRDTARAAGITNGLLIAMLAEEETYLSHCANEFAACPGPVSSDCGGRAVLSGGGDGPCSRNQGGLGMFQIDDGTESDTVRVHGNRVLTLRGNTEVAIQRVIEKVQRSTYLRGTAQRDQAIAAINEIRIDDARWDSWIRTLVRYWNGCPESGSCWSNRYPKYDRAARTLYSEFGHAFWYGDTTPTPTPGSGWLSSPIQSPRVSSHVSNRRGSGWARYDCQTLTRANHRGTDFGVAQGTPVHAAAPGTVIRSTTGCPANGSMSSTCGGSYGNHVIVLHDGGRATLYAHLRPDGAQVRNGARVECGDLIGNSGNSGRSSGPHLHFEVRNNVRDVNSYFNSGVTLDPYGGACSSQTESLWIGGTPTASCSAAADRDDSNLQRASHASEVRSAGGVSITQTFTWRNTGTTTWTSDEYTMRHVGGAFSEAPEVTLPSGTRVAPGGQLQLTVTVTAPTAAGLHQGRWRLAREGMPFGAEGSLKVRVSGTARSCNSSTLRRTVAHGECVQVDYPACSTQSCGWYMCNDGTFQCTAPGACMGTLHDMPACTMNPSGPQDGGVDAGPVCVGPGQPLNAICETADDCCDGLECGTAHSGQRVCCRESEDRCSRHDDCCGSMLCVAGHCACAPVDQLCLNDSECCNGLACIAGACRDISSCTREGVSCGDGSECCHPLRCNPSAGGGANTCCISGNNVCEVDSDCCGDMTCESGRCRYRQAGESCADVLDCYGALLCRDGRCAL